MSGSEALRAQAKKLRQAAQNPPSIDPLKSAVNRSLLAAQAEASRAGQRQMGFVVTGDAKTIRVRGTGAIAHFQRRLSAELPRARAEILRQAKERLR